MQLPEMHSGQLLRRYKRFLADIELDSGEIITAHTPNTGSMKQCAEPGSRVLCSRSENPQRKYPYTFELVHVAGSWVDINTQRSNKIVAEGLEHGIIQGFANHQVRPEQRLGSSRIDFCLESAHDRVWMEVKNVTYMGTTACACFPDAQTSRGRRHLQELEQACARGERGIILFLVQRAEAELFAPAADIDPDYAAMLREVLHQGVEPLAYQTRASATQVSILRRLPVIV